MEKFFKDEIEKTKSIFKRQLNELEKMKKTVEEHITKCHQESEKEKSLSKKKSSSKTVKKTTKKSFLQKR